MIVLSGDENGEVHTEGFRQVLFQNKRDWGLFGDVTYENFLGDHPFNHASAASAAFRPSAMAQTTSDWPRRASPAAKTPGIEVW
jgi:hypothetical protein